MSDNLPDI